MFVGDLEDRELHYWVLRAQGFDDAGAKVFVRNNFEPSVDWEQGGPIVEKAKIAIRPADTGLQQWLAVGPEGGKKFEHTGRTPLIAAMRAFVAAKFGNEVSKE